jgi:hypothetical protein
MLILSTCTNLYSFEHRWGGGRGMKRTRNSQKYLPQYTPPSPPPTLLSVHFSNPHAHTQWFFSSLCLPPTSTGRGPLPYSLIGEPALAAALPLVGLLAV